MTQPSIVSITKLYRTDTHASDSGHTLDDSPDTSFTVPTLVNGAIVVVLDDYVAAMSNMRLNSGSGAAFTQFGTRHVYSGNALGFWYLLNPTPGTYGLWLQPPGGDTAAHAFVYVLQDVDQTTPFGTLFASAGQSITVTDSTTDDLVICGIALAPFEAETAVDVGNDQGNISGGGASVARLDSSWKNGTANTAFVWSGAPDSGIGAFAVKGAAGTPPATPAKLAILTQPDTSGVKTHHSFTITVAVQTAAGATVTTDTSSVTLAPSGTGSVTYSGSLTVSAVAGVATFTLTPTKNTDGASITFTASDGSLTPAATTAIAHAVQSLDVAVS